MSRYVKKIEPLRRYEVLLGGVTLQAFLIMYHILPWINIDSECINAIYKSDVSSEEDMLSFHDCAERIRGELLFSGSTLLLGFPIIVLHIYYEFRMGSTIFAFNNTGALRWLYGASWSMIGIIGCSVIPSMAIFVCYYDWELSNDYQYIGYVIQKQLFDWMLILWDCLILPLGMAAITKLMMGLSLLLDIKLCQSSYYNLSPQSREEIVGKFLSLPFGKYIVSFMILMVILVVLFGSIGDTFDFAKSGFWSYTGNSQYLRILIFAVLQLQCFALYSNAYKFDKNITFFSENISPNDHDETLTSTKKRKSGVEMQTV